MSSLRDLVVDRPDHKKVKVETVGKDMFHTMCEILHGMRKEVRDKGVTFDRTSVEVEIRVGMLVGNDRRWKAQTHSSKLMVEALDDFSRSKRNLEFKAGVDEIYLEGLKKIFGDLGIHGEVQPLQRLRIDDRQNRFEINAAGDVTKAESKTNFYRYDLALFSHEYDIRMNAASEMPSSAPSSSSSSSSSSVGDLSKNWSLERLKRRTTYRKKASAWKIDVTEVEVTSRYRSSETKRELELEFELEPGRMAPWLNEDDEERAVEITKNLAGELYSLVNLCISYHSDQPSVARPMEIVTTDVASEVSKYNEFLKAELLGAASSSASSMASGHLEFIGSMPMNLCRKNLLALQQNEYFVTEKSDGTRYLLYVIEHNGSPTAVLMDRSKNPNTIFRMHGAHEVGNALGVGTVLDGELVFNRTYREYVFLVFDVLMFDKVAVLQLPFGTRLKKIEVEVIVRYKKHLAAAAAATTTTVGGGMGSEKPTILVRKNFVAKRHLSELISKMRMEGKERVFYEGESRHHKSDGIIFQPDTSYCVSTDVALLKWKWPELR